MSSKIDNILVSEGNRPLWQIIIAAVFYTVSLLLMLLSLYILYIDFTINAAKDCVGILSFATTAFVLAVRFSLVNNIYFDFEKRLYKKEYAVGIFRFGTWQHLPNIEYICVFRQSWSKDSDGDGMSDSAGYRYDVNVWHDSSKHFTIYTNFEKEPSYEMAKHLATKMKVDFLDATDPHNKQWVELEELAL